jgi:hypothetical protein
MFQQRDKITSKYFILTRKAKMANFKFDSKEEKVRLKARAEALKPKVANVVATALGWAQSRPNGTLELLVSFRGLDELLGDMEPEAVDPNPVEVNVLISVEADIEKVPETVEPPVTKEEEDEPVVVAPPKKGGRPKKVVA